MQRTFPTLVCNSMPVINVTRVVILFVVLGQAVTGIHTSLRKSVSTVLSGTLAGSESNSATWRLGDSACLHGEAASKERAIAQHFREFWLAHATRFMNESQNPLVNACSLKHYLAVCSISLQLLPTGLFWTVRA